MTDYFPDTENESEIDSWVIGKLANKPMEDVSSEEYTKYLHKFDDVILEAIEKANLQSGWFAYMGGAFIALGNVPKTIAPVHRLKIFVEGISEDENSLVVRLNKGLSSEDYKKAWNMLKRFLQKPSTAPIYADVLKNKVYLDRQNGMTYGALAKKYFLHEYQKDKENGTDFARDKVKKITERMRIGKIRKVKENKKLLGYQPKYGLNYIPRIKTGPNARDGYFEINEKHAEVVRMIFEWASLGMSKYTIRDELFERGITPPRGKSKQ